MILFSFHYELLKIHFRSCLSELCIMKNATVHNWIFKKLNTDLKNIYIILFEFYRTKKYKVFHTLTVPKTKYILHRKKQKYLGPYIYFIWI